MAASVAGRLARCVALAALTLFVTLAVTETRAQNNAGGSAGLKQARFLKQARQSPSGTINVRSAKEFGDLTSTPRDYSISMLLTAVDSPPINCAPCKAFQPVFESVAKGYKAAAAKTASPSQHMFAVLEFKEGREVFQRVSRDGQQDWPSGIAYELHQRSGTRWDGVQKVSARCGSGQPTYLCCTVLLKLSTLRTRGANTSFLWRRCNLPTPPFSFSIHRRVARMPRHQAHTTLTTLIV